MKNQASQCGSGACRPWNKEREPSLNLSIGDCIRAGALGMADDRRRGDAQTAASAGRVDVCADRVAGVPGLVTESLKMAGEVVVRIIIHRHLGLLAD